MGGMGTLHLPLLVLSSCVEFLVLQCAPLFVLVLPPLALALARLPALRLFSALFLLPLAHTLTVVLEIAMRKRNMYEDEKKKGGVTHRKQCLDCAGGELVCLCYTKNYWKLPLS